jgi:hypothetical protein
VHARRKWPGYVTNTCSTYFTILHLGLKLGTASERTTEVNILFDMSLRIKQRSKTNVTIVSPAKVGRYEQVSDHLAQILRNGRIIIFQFVEDIIHIAFPECRVKSLKTLQLGICQTDSHFLD